MIIPLTFLGNIFFGILGLVIGSFISAVSFRLPRGISIVSGRSICDQCERQLRWYDNIPFFSYLFLKGKCSACGKKISSRYPIIETLTAAVFIGTFYLYMFCTEGSFVCLLKDHLYILTLPFLLFVGSILITIVIIDFEKRIIPDELVFLLFSISFVTILLGSVEDIYIRLLCGFGSGSFLLLLNLCTRGRGMGLGDVKLAIPLGFLAGWPGSFIWLTGSFVIGGIISLVLLALGKAHFGNKIAFGPFMVVGFGMLIWLSPYLSKLFIFL